MGSLVLNTPVRSYAVSSAEDGEITFSLSSSHGASRSQWFREVFDYLAEELGITFKEVASGSAELNFQCIPISAEEYNTIDGGEPSLVTLKGTGLIQWKSAKDTRQYGGVQDQLTACRAILRALGLSYPGGSPWNLDISQTILSSIKTSAGTFGHTFFPTQMDLNALVSLYGPNTKRQTQFNRVHYSGIEESLLVGSDGVKDLFYITVKGVNPFNQSSITYDDIGPIYNDYNNASIANFSFDDGDRIVIQRRLFSPYDSDISATDQWLESEGQQLKTSYVYSGDPSKEWMTRETNSALIFNDAGKLMINANGEAPGLGPEYGVNNYLIAFIDTSSGPQIAQLNANSFMVFDHSFVGGSRSDLLKGGSGSDLMIGGADDDVLRAGGGQDKILGGEGNDYLGGGQGGDYLFGDMGDDTIFAGNGRRKT